MTKRFVKSADTETAASASQVQLEKVLRRYGAHGFGVQSDYQAHLIRVSFRVPDVQGSQTTVPVRLEVSIEAVAKALFPSTRTCNERAWAQAERVAWRHLVLWVDAACSAASAGLQTMSEAFFAHVLVKGDAGTVVRVIDQLNGRGEWRALLPAGEGTT